MNNIIKIGIIGLGLIGASLLKALNEKNGYEIYCVSNSSFKKAQKYCHLASNDIKIVQNCDIIFVCSKVSETLSVLNKLNEFLGKNTIVCDVASIKKDLSNKEFNFNFILSHPMAGSEKTGFDAGDKNLFKGAKWLIEKNNEILEKIIIDTGAKVHKIDMKTHDSLTAQISHLPTILSFLLFDSANDEAKKIASSGFRDTTRLAMTNSELALSMFKNNEENILKAFDILCEKLDNLKTMSDNEKTNFFNKIIQSRAKMYDNNGKNIF